MTDKYVVINVALGQFAFKKTCHPVNKRVATDDAITHHDAHDWSMQSGGSHTIFLKRARQECFCCGLISTPATVEQHRCQLEPSTATVNLQQLPLGSNNREVIKRHQSV
ncbi:hypothetical protein BDR07DRAFT_1393066 [Suillus spraguei]|nr:hypothetical protein BDR07DRAFT_1393066 [Suillus spraguei]